MLGDFVGVWILFGCDWVYDIVGDDVVVKIDVDCCDDGFGIDEIGC